MAGTRSANTMTEQLRSLLGQIAEMKAAPDADIAYLTSLETQVLQFLRKPFEEQRLQAQLQGPGGAGGAGAGGGAPAPGPAEQLLFGAPPTPAGGMGGGMGGMPAGVGGPVGGGVPGVRTAPNMGPPADELRRLLEQPAL